MHFDIYTDGACSGNPGPGGYGAIIVANGKETVISGGYDSTTNNRMELMAAVRALRLIKDPSSITLYSDSKYLVDAINKNWLVGWVLNGWVNSSNKKVKNIDLWKQLIPELKRHNIEFVWVKGHSSNEMNNRCDGLARKEISRFKR